MWNVITTECFDEWFLAQTDELRESVYEAMGILEKFGPGLGRPYVDTLNGSDFANMKEMRIQHCGNPVRAFLRLTLLVGPSFFVRAIKQEQMKSVFIKI